MESDNKEPREGKKREKSRGIYDYFPGSYEDAEEIFFQKFNGFFSK